jgi:hypothetical protein
LTKAAELLAEHSKRAAADAVASQTDTPAAPAHSHKEHLLRDKEFARIDFERQARRSEEQEKRQYADSRHTKEGLVAIALALATTGSKEAKLAFPSSPSETGEGSDPSEKKVEDWSEHDVAKFAEVDCKFGSTIAAGLLALDIEGSDLNPYMQGAAFDVESFCQQELQAGGVVTMLNDRQKSKLKNKLQLVLQKQNLKQKSA